MAHTHAKLDAQRLNELSSGDNRESRYASWVPTVLGSLSFAHVESTSSFGNGRCYPDGHASMYMVLGRTITSDHIAASIQSRFGTTSGVHNVFLVAKSDDPIGKVGSITGEVFFCPSQSRSGGKYSEDRCVSFYDSCERLVNETPYSSASGFKDSIEKIRSLSLVRCEFELHRSGLVYIDLDHKHVSSLFDYSPVDKLDELKIAIGFYNAIRDIFHTHKHHDPRVDNIVSVARITEPEVTEEWARTIQYSMTRKIIALHGIKDEISQNEAAGITAYLRTFNKLFVDPEKSATVEDGSLLIPMLENFEASIQAQEKRFAAKRAEVLQAIFIFIGVTSLWVGGVQALKAVAADKYIPLSFAGVPAALLLYFGVVHRERIGDLIGITRHSFFLKGWRVLFALLALASVVVLYIQWLKIGV